MTLKYRYRKQILIGVLITLIITLVGGGSYFLLSDKNKKNEIVVAKSLKKESKNKSETPLKKEQKEETKKIMVDVKGCVNAPGIYTLDEDSRIIDAINMASGFTNEADSSVLNLSKKLKDEMVIIVYSYYEVSIFKKVRQIEKQVQEECVKGINDIGNDACIEENNSTDKTTTVSGKVSINTATIEELMTLEGIGESKAKSIIEYREKNGLFKTIEDLLNVGGIGEGLFAKIKENITV